MRKYYLYFLPSQVSPPHLTDPWKKPCRFSQQERVRKASADAQHILSILLKASRAPSVHANIHDGFSNSCPVQGYMKRWPCWPLSCGQMPTTKRTWCSSKMSSVRGVWDTWWRWGIMILVRMVQALQMITCNKLKHLLFVYAVKVYFLFFWITTWLHGTGNWYLVSLWNGATTVASCQNAPNVFIVCL